MSDYLLTYAKQLDGEPECRCTSTDKGPDTLGCDQHSRCPRTPHDDELHCICWQMADGSAGYPVYCCYCACQSEHTTAAARATALAEGE